MFRTAAILLLSVALTACHTRTHPPGPRIGLATATSSTPPPMAITLAPQINPADLVRYGQTLTSPALAGRKPGTRGEIRTTDYLIAQLRRMHLAPGYRGRWRQPVPMVSTQLLNTGVQLRVRTPAGVQRLAYGTEMLAGTQQARARVALRNSPVVFLGYGIDAPRRHWNDYRDVDLRGKTVLVLSNDPGYTTGDPQLFNGRSMSAYGRARDKFAAAARRGAAACFIIHAAPGSALPWSVLRDEHAGAAQALPARVAPGPRLAVAGWIDQAAAERLVHAAGASLRALMRAAARPGFQPVPLDATASITLHSAIRYSWSDNVLALIRGAVHPDQAVIYSAHWDGLGVALGPRGRAERFPGAIDNAVGVGALLEIADTFAQRKRPPARSILFLLPTLGDAGQLGSRYYVEHPVFALDRTVADINIDTWPVIGRARDMTVFGATGGSELDTDLRQVLALQGRVLTTDPDPQIGSFYRSDQYSFARVGVPAIFAAPGLDLVGGGRAAGQADWENYLVHRFHTPRDTFNPHWHLSGTLEDIETLYLLGRTLANGTQWPNWGSDSPYRARRDALMAQRRAPQAPSPSAP